MKTEAIAQPFPIFAGDSLPGVVQRSRPDGGPPSHAKKKRPRDWWQDSGGSSNSLTGGRIKETREMETQNGTTRHELLRRGLLSGLALIALAGVLVVSSVTRAEAQFNSGSSGIHGVFPPVPQGGNPTTDGHWIIWNIRTGTVRYCSAYTLGTGSDQCDSGSTVNLTAQIEGTTGGGPATGIYQFQSFTVPAIGDGRELVVVGHSPNTPLAILSQGDINIGVGANGCCFTFIRLNGFIGKNPGGSSPGFSVAGGKGGPGGFDGGASGNGGSTPSDGNAGFGPAGGAAGHVTATLSDFYAGSASAGPLNPSLTPISGGSGGGGGAGVSAGSLGCESNTVGFGGGSGGGGGGALLLAASGRVTFNIADIVATGGNGGQNANSGPCRLYGGGGAGGSVRIVAQEFTGTNNSIIHVGGGLRPDGAARASGGFVRIETASNTFAGSIDSAAGGSFISFPTAPVPVNQPLLQITSLNNITVPVSPATTLTAALTSPDITFTQAVSQVTVGISASNVPDGTSINIKVVPAAGSFTTSSATLNSGTAQATVTLPPGAGIITATATFNVGSLPPGAALSPNSLPLIDGERPQQVEVAAMADGTSRTYLLSRSGARFELGRIAR